MPALERRSQGLDVALEGCVVRRVVGRVVTDDIQHRHIRPTRVVQIRPAVGESRSQVQQRGGRLTGDACVAVGRPGGDALEEAQDGADLGDVVESGDEMHFRSAGIGEAGREAIGPQRGE